MNPIFPEIPPLTDRQRKAVTFGNEQVLRAWLHERPRSVAELKRAIIVESGRPGYRSVLGRLLSAYSKAERLRVTDAIEKQRRKS